MEVAAAFGVCKLKWLVGNWVFAVKRSLFGLEGFACHDCSLT